MSTTTIHLIFPENSPARPGLEAGAEKTSSTKEAGGGRPAGAAAAER